MAKKHIPDIPKPTPEQVDHYLQEWDENEVYCQQEAALNKLFGTLCPANTELADILLKVAALNDFYSTNIFSIYPVAEHILSLRIDKRLRKGDLSLVADMQKVTIRGTERNFYSFATKYCSHHRPEIYPIYDDYVGKILRHFYDIDKFMPFLTLELKDYERYEEIVREFRTFYKLEQYNIKEIDQYLWQLGKKYYPRNYGKSKVSPHS